MKTKKLFSAIIIILLLGTLSVVLNFDKLFPIDTKSTVRAESLSIVLPTYLPDFNFDNNVEISSANLEANLDATNPELKSEYIFNTEIKESLLDFCIPTFDSNCFNSVENLDVEINNIKLHPEIYFSDGLTVSHTQLSYEQVIGEQILNIKTIDLNKTCYSYVFNSDVNGIIEFTVPQDATIIESFNSYSTGLGRNYKVNVSSSQEFYVIDGEINILDNSNVRIEKRQIKILDIYNDILDFYSIMYNFGDCNTSIAEKFLYFKIGKALDNKYANLMSLYTAPEQNKFIYLKYSTVLPIGVSKINIKQQFYSSIDNRYSAPVQNFYLMSDFKNLNFKLTFLTDRYVLKTNAYDFQKQNNVMTFEGILTERFPINVCEVESFSTGESEYKFPVWVIVLWTIAAISSVILIIIVILWIRDSLKNRKSN